MHNIVCHSVSSLDLPPYVLVVTQAVTDGFVYHGAFAFPKQLFGKWCKCRGKCTVQFCSRANVPVNLHDSSPAMAERVVRKSHTLMHGTAKSSHSFIYYNIATKGLRYGAAAWAAVYTVLPASYTPLATANPCPMRCATSATFWPKLRLQCLACL